MHQTTFFVGLIISVIIFTTACTPSSELDSSQSNSHEHKPSKRNTIMKELSIPAPIAQKIEHTQTHHGITITDPYHWLKDSDYPKVDDGAVLDYLKAENAYYQSFLAPNSELVESIFEEFKGRTKDDDQTVPYVSNGYEYKMSFNKGEEYPLYIRRALSSDAEEIYLNVPDIAKPYDYFTLGDIAISPNNQYVAYSYNTNGDERYTIVVKDLNTGIILDDIIADTSGDIVFGKDNKTLVYGQLDSVRWFINSVRVHQIGTTQKDDKTLFTENDEGFFIDFDLTSSKQYLVINSGQTELNESYVLPTDNLYSTPIKMVAREQAFLNDIDHAHGYFYIKANDTHVNSRLAKVNDNELRVAGSLYDKWETVIEGSDQRYLKSVALFEDFMVAAIRENGIERLVVSAFENGAYQQDTHDVAFPEDVFDVNFSQNPEFSQDFIRLSYSSMITPRTIYDYHVSDKRLDTKKVQDIPSGYDKSHYVTKRIMAPARDSAMVPVTIVYKKGFEQDASRPMFLYGYGAYGLTVEPSFSTLRLSLLDRGFSYAIAHVRGSDMLGFNWYLDGKLDKRKNTFNDFVDVATHLIEEKYVAKGNISIGGRSAGGELMGAVINQAPEYWRSVNLGVPFVDVLNTMLDASLPLTPPEWVEWGNPIEDAAAFEYIKSYSPYDNIEAKEYPPMFVSGGLNDPRVTYWEPAKWTAKMRATKTDDNLLVMRINMGAGHFSNSGRYGRLKDYAEEYAFTLLAHDIHK